MDEFDFQGDLRGLIEANADAMHWRDLIVFALEERAMSPFEVYQILLDHYENTDSEGIEDVLQETMGFLTGHCNPALRVTDPEVARALRRESATA